MPEQSGDLYFSVEGYFQGMVPDDCWSGSYPLVKLFIYKNTKTVIYSAQYYYDSYHRPVQVLEADYGAGSKFIFQIKYEWSSGNSAYPYRAQDYTFKVYSK